MHRRHFGPVPLQLHGGLRATVSFAGALIAVLACAAAASAHFDTAGQYTHKGCPGTSSNRIDPINIVFYNWGTYDRAARSTEAHAGWYDQGGSGQYFVDHGNCYFMHTQRAQSGVASSRFHIRFRGQHSDTLWGWTTTGDAHHEDLVFGFSGCWDNGGWGGHAVDANGPNGSGFDQGRRELRTRIEAGGHSWFSQQWGNTQNFQQCDGDWARSDGTVVFLNEHQAYH
jgi:hypothetical protein